MISSIGASESQWHSRPDISGRYIDLFSFYSLFLMAENRIFSSLGMMYAPQTVAPQHAQTAGMFAAAMLITGIVTGLTTAKVFPTVVRNLSW